MKVAIKIATNSAWGLLPFEEAVTDATSGNPKIPQKEYLSTGELPVIDQGQQEIGGYVDDVNLKCKEKLPCIVFGDHTKSIKFIDYNFALGADGVKVLVPKRNDIDKKYLYRFLQTIKLPDDAGYSRHYKFLKRAMVPLPPLDEQKRIAEILDKADAIRRKRAESLKLLDDLLRATFLDMFGDPITNPKGWPTKQLADVVAQGTIVTYGIVQAGPEYPGGVPYIRTGDIKNGAILQDRLLHTSPEIASKFKRSEVKAGDLVMSIRATVGTLAMVPSSLAGSNLTQGTAKISPGPEVDGKFLFSYITSEGCQNWIQRQVKGATFREITLSKLREMPIAVPNKNIQYQFRAICDQIETIKMQYVTHTTESDTLFHSLVARAFKGEL